MSADTTPQTKAEAYREVKKAGDDVALRRRIAAALTGGGRTTHELTTEFDHSKNAIRPRLNELLRMGCVRRTDTRTNPSGHEAYVHELTTQGYRYAAGEIDPDPAPPLAEHRKRVVKVARAVCRGEADRDILQLAVERHDAAKRRADPEWNGGL